jgi:hypothetical protein
MTRRELLVTLAVLAAGIALLAIAGGSVLWTRPLWFDELCCVSYVVSDASSPLEVVRRVAHSWDYAPPLLHLLVWPIARLAGGELTPVVLRSLSLIAVCAALVFVYAALRRRLARLPSVGGALAVAGHALVIGHAFEGRFYGFWLLFAAGYAWSLGVSAARRRDIAQAIFSILLVGIHWFGIFSLSLMALGAAAVLRGPLRTRLRTLAGSAPGFIAALALAPMAITQRSGAVGYLWLPPLNGDQIAEFARLFWIAAVPVVAAIVVLGRTFRNETADPSLSSVLRDPSMAGMLSLSLMPLLLMVISALLQPSMLDRYGIVSILAWAPVVALALASVGGLVRVACVAGLVFVMLLNGQRVVTSRRDFAADVAAMRGAYDEAKSRQLPIVFWGLHSIYPVAGPISQRTPRALARYLDLPDSSLAALFPGDAMEPVRRKYRLDRDQARGHARTYGFPVLATQAQLESTPRFLLIAGEASLPGGYKRPETFGRALFPEHRVSRVNEMISLFELPAR